MNKRQKEEAARYRQSLTDAGLLESEIRGLHSLASKLQVASELECSVQHFFYLGQWWESGVEPCATDKIEAGLDRWLDKVNARLTHPTSSSHALGAFEMENQGDPRGSVVKLRGRGLPCTSWGGEGWFCIEAQGLRGDNWAVLQAASDARAETLKLKAIRKAFKAVHGNEAAIQKD